MINFQPVEVVGRSSETQLQVVEKIMLQFVVQALVNEGDKILQCTQLVLRIARICISEK